MSKINPIMVLYRIEPQPKQDYPNAFIINHNPQNALTVVKIKQSFPWGQINCSKQADWVFRFGLNIDQSMNCDMWLDITDNDVVPFVGDNQVLVKLQQK